jgi:hypothetical protein
MGPIRNPRWEQKQTEGYVIVSTPLLVVASHIKTLAKRAFKVLLLELYYRNNMKNVTTIDPNKDISKTRQVHMK